MPITLDGTAGITNDATDLNYTGTLTGGTGVINIGSGQLYKDASGNVGIGTSSPTSGIQLGSPSANAVGTSNTLRIFRGGVAGQYAEIDNTDAAFRINAVNGAGGGILFLGDGSERARIDSSGNLLVGTTTSFPGDGNTATGFMVQAGVGGKVFASVVDNAEAGNFNRNGNGTLVKMCRSGVTVGSISVTTTATSYITSSDYRLKHDIQPMTGALAKVAQLKPVTYKWNADDSESQGFIAHELQEVVPECVTGEKDAVEIVEVKDENGEVIGTEERPVYQGIDTSFLVATLTAALQEAVTEINSLKARVEALEGAQA
jgi:hypothetical protein